jgi:hypothetical protein
MSNIAPLDVEYFESFANEIEGKLNRVKKLVQHNVASGNYHEEILRTILRNFLSKRYSVKTGFIYKSKKEVSKQIDILIIDENSPAAYLFQEGDFAIVVPESVVAVMEVKTTMDSSKWNQSISNIASAKRLMEFPGELTSIIFAYQGYPSRDDTLGKWFTGKESTIVGNSNQPLSPDAISFFTEGQLLVTHNENNEWTKAGKYYQKLFRSDSVKQKGVTDAGWQLSVVLALIIAACEYADFRISRRFKDGSIADMLWEQKGAMSGKVRFLLGKGLLK